MCTGRSIVLFLVVLGIAAALPAAGLAAKITYTSCGGGFNPDGSKGGFYRQIRAGGLGCVKARSVTKAWVRYQDMTDGANPTKKVTVSGYKCSGKAVSSPGDPNGGLSVLCVAGSKRVRFYGHP